MKKSNQNSASQNIKVFVRVRPMNHQERASKSSSCIATTNHTDHHKITVREGNKPDKPFTFDRVFNLKSTQIDVFRHVAQPLVEEVLNGFSCTIFAYGQTSSGKTYTMEGEGRTDESWDENNAGIIPRCISQLFDELRMQNVEEYTMKVSFLELYNEELIDLLSNKEDFTKLRLYESMTQKGSCQIQGLEEVVVKSKSEVFKILAHGSTKRQTAATLMNQSSSRSHTVFTITIQVKENTVDGDELIKIGRLHLVDLAGSENIGRSGAVDKRAKEAGNINVSLLTLGRVITSLVEKAPHIPYRESKLTRLLQDALGGKTKTSIIATISPASSNVEETLSTLYYANRAKNIKNCPEVNKRVTKREILDDYTEEILTLKQALSAQRDKEGVYLANEQYEDMVYQMNSQNEEIQEKIALIRAHEGEIEKIKEDFNRLGMEFSETLDKLNFTESSLVKTKETLRCTQTLLSEKAFERDEQAYLVSAHVNTEEKLHKQGSDLINVAIKTSTDIEQLHNKLDRKRNVEATNEAIGQEFSHEVEDHMSLLKSDLRRNMTQYQEASTRMSDNISNLFEVQLEMNSLREDLQDMSSIPPKVLQELGEKFSYMIKKSTEVLNDYALECQHKYQEEQKELSSIKEKQDGLTRNLATLISSLATTVPTNESINEKINELNEICSSTSKFSLDELLSLTDKMGKIQKTYQQTLKEEFEEDKKQMKRDLDTLFDKYILNMGKYTSLQNENMGMTLEITDSMFVSAKTMLEEKSNANKQAALIAGEANASLKENSLQVEEHIRGLGECRCSLESTSDDHFASSIKNINSLQQNTEDFVQRQTKMSSDFESGILDKVNTESSNFSSLSDELISKLNQEIKVLREEVETLENELSSQSECHKTFQLYHEENLENVNGYVNSLFSEKLSRDIPTGLTPDRREYIFPRTLAKTSPAEVVKRRYRVAMNVGSKIPLPTESLDSSNEENFKEPLTFSIPPVPRQDSKIECHSAPVSRSSSASSLLEMKENVAKDYGFPSLKKQIRPPTDFRPTRSRRILGSYNS